jgi:hypothetical protein
MSNYHKGEDKHFSISVVNKNLDEAFNWLMTTEDKSRPILIEQIGGLSEHR